MPDWVKQGKKYSCERVTPFYSPNDDFIENLKKIKHARELSGDEIGVRAYSTAIASIKAYPHRLKSSREIRALPGCEAKVISLFQEWKASDGRIQEVEIIESDERLKILHEFWEIWGVGPTTARDFYAKGWRDLDDLVEYNWKGLSRVQQIGLKFYDEFLVKIPRKEVEDIAAIVVEHAKAVRDDGIECCIVGGYRRGKQACGDVDMILSHREHSKTRDLIEDVVRSLEQARWITHTLTLSLAASKRDQQVLPFRAGGEHTGGGFDTLDKALVVWQDPKWEAPSGQEGDPPAKNPNIHRRVDIIIAPWSTVGCAIVGWSGETTFQRDLRNYATKVKHYKFDSSGVRDRTTGEVVDMESVGGVSKTWLEAEKKVFAGLDLEYREPWERCTS
jgi:DNA polymerase IV